MKNDTGYNKYIYWVPGGEFKNFRNNLNSTEFNLQSVRKTSCETLNAIGKTVRYASPKVFSGLCKRQGSWYRESNRDGHFLVVSEEKLPEQYDHYLNANMVATDFSPEVLPVQSDLMKLVESEEYQSQRPDDWENKTFKEALMYKIMFTLTGFWGFGDNLAKHWNNHCANHANFLTHRFTTKIDDESIPYSVTNNDGVCSSCVEFFNVIDQESRKMVRACPGAVHFSSVEGHKYYEVRPVKTALAVGSK